MNIEQIDAHCDEYERHLQNGGRLSAEQFLQERKLPGNDALVADLRKLQQEYREKIVAEETAIQSAPADSIDSRLSPQDETTDQSVIGNYKLLQKIGEGGMGLVYMAEQTKPVARRVALKIIKPGMASREILARFEAERQALAMMDHPNIAKVLDAGTDRLGRPYFVMELVKGVPITTYCDDRQLSLTERLELFLPVCRAAQHAHQKGIIHRDLKPSNVLVAQFDSSPVPKIIDFGLAKAIGQKLTERTMYTQFGQIVGTIDYMSPEQATFNQLDVDTRSDIYSLGVLLYELLAGETPFDRKRLHSAAIDEMLRIIRNEEPPRPSARLSSSTLLPKIAANRRSEEKNLSGLVSGELDWIVMKAIEKERDRRYQSALALADDISRYLSNDAVLACPPSPAYRLRKLARRHRVALSVVAVIFASLLTGLAGTAWALVQANISEQRVRTELRQKEAYISRLTQTFRVDQFQRQQYFLFEQAASKLVRMVLTKLYTDPTKEPADSQLLRKAITTALVAFWQDMIEADRDTSGKPGQNTPRYQLQLAHCMARSGDVKAAWQKAQDLEDRILLDTENLSDCIRLYGICAKVAESDPGLAELYSDAAIRLIRLAGKQSEEPPPSDDDPDLAPLKSHPEFSILMQSWQSRQTRISPRLPATVTRRHD